MEPSEPDSIAAQCTRIVGSTDRLIAQITNTHPLPSGMTDSDMLDEQDRFHIWVGNVGALSGIESPPSLEKQLSEAPQVQ